MQRLLKTSNPRARFMLDTNLGLLMSIGVGPQRLFQPPLPVIVVDTEFPQQDGQLLGTSNPQGRDSYCSDSAPSQARETCSHSETDINSFTIYCGWLKFHGVPIFVVFVEGHIHKFQYSRNANFLYELWKKILWPQSWTPRMCQFCSINEN